MLYLIALLGLAALMSQPPEKPKPYTSKKGTDWYPIEYDRLEKEWIWESTITLVTYYCGQNTHNLGNAAWFTYTEDRSYTNGPTFGSCYEAMDNNRE